MWAVSWWEVRRGWTVWDGVYENWVRFVVWKRVAVIVELYFNTQIY